MVVRLATHDGKYTSNERIIRVKPYCSMNESTDLYMIQRYLQPGFYKIYASTNVSISALSSAKDSNTVTIK